MSINVNDFIGNFKSSIIRVLLNNGTFIEVRKNTINIDEIWFSGEDIKNCSFLIRNDSIIGFFEVVFEKPAEYIANFVNEPLDNHDNDNDKEYSFTRRIANNKIIQGFTEGESFNNKVFQDPIERVKDLAKKKIEENRLLKESISSHMSNTNLSEVKFNYAVPSFKKRT
jgi:hypothetical protein